MNLDIPGYFSAQADHVLTINIAAMLKLYLWFDYCKALSVSPLTLIM